MKHSHLHGSVIFLQLKSHGYSVPSVSGAQPKETLAVFEMVGAPSLTSTSDTSIHYLEEIWFLSEFRKKPLEDAKKDSASLRCSLLALQVSRPRLVVSEPLGLRKPMERSVHLRTLKLEQLS